jgi:hypothetical protein
MSSAAVLTLELTRRPRAAFNLIFKDNDESHAIGRSGRMTCSAAAYGVTTQRVQRSALLGQTLNLIT